MILFLFALGIGNFAFQKAVLDSGHPILDVMPQFWRANGGRIAMGLEFGILVAAMLMVDAGILGGGIAYAIYTALNALTAWLILTHRV